MTDLTLALLIFLANMAGTVSGALIVVAYETWAHQPPKPRRRVRRFPLSAGGWRGLSGRVGRTKEDSPRAALVTPQTEGLATNDLEGVV